MSAVELHGIVKRYGPVTALDGVDLRVARGEVHAVVGENGAGKTTLMSVLAGVVAADAGGIRSTASAVRSARSRTPTRTASGWSTSTSSCSGS